jgi:hypothetical protein
MHRALFTLPILSAIATTLFTSPVQAQSCASLLQRPVDKGRLNAIAASVGISNSPGVSVEVLNPGVYEGTNVAPLSVGSGTRSRLQNFRVNQ